MSSGMDENHWLNRGSICLNEIFSSGAGRCVGDVIKCIDDLCDELKLSGRYKKNDREEIKLYWN